MNLFERLLDRSGSLPLKIRMGDLTDAILDRLAPSFRRVAVLQINEIHIDNQVAAIKNAITCGGLCNLSSLTLLREAHPRRRLDLWEIEPNLPALTSLDLSGSLLYPNLVVATLVRLTIRDFASVLFHSLVRVLGRCVALEELSLLHDPTQRPREEDTPGPIDGIGEDTRLAALPHLRKLHIHDTAHVISYVLGRLDIPRFSAHFLLDTTSSSSTTLSGIVRAAYPKGLPPIDRLAIAFHHRSRRCLINCFQGPSVCLTTSVNIVLADDILAIVSFVSDLSRTCTTATVDLRGSPDVFTRSPVVLLLIMQKLTGLRRLEILHADTASVNVAVKALLVDYPTANELMLACVFPTMKQTRRRGVVAAREPVEFQEALDALEKRLRDSTQIRLKRLELYATADIDLEERGASLDAVNMVPQECCSELVGPTRLAALKKLVDVLVVG